MQKSKIIFNPEDDNNYLNINAKEFIPVSMQNPVQNTNVINYKDFHNDPNNSDIKYVVEAFLNDPNEITLSYITWIDNDEKIIFEYVCNCMPYSKQVFMNKKIFIDYNNQVFRLNV